MSAWTDLGALATGGALALALGGGIAILLAQLPLRPRPMPLPLPRYGFDRAAPQPLQVPPRVPERPHVRAISVCVVPARLGCCVRPSLMAA